VVIWFATKAKGTLARPLVWSKSSYLFFFLAAFFVAFFFVAIVFYSPFHLSWNIATFISSQFDSCIDSLKKIVKRKTHTETQAG